MLNITPSPSKESFQLSRAQRVWGTLMGFVVILAIPAIGYAGIKNSTSPERSLSANNSQSALPFDMPSTAVLRSSPKKVFAHYMTTSAVSIDNKPAESDYITNQFLNPHGEGDKHVTYGGFWRDRPQPRDPLPAETWRIDNMKREIQQATAAGIDGFMVDILVLKGSKDVPSAMRPFWLAQAAQEIDPGFKITLMPDMAAGPGSLSASDLAGFMAEIAASPAVYRLDDGRVVIAPYLAEVKNAQYWMDFMRVMKDTYQMPVAFYPVMQHFDVLESYKPFTYGTGNWGSRNPVANDPTKPGYKQNVDSLHSAGLKWMQPVSAQDTRPRSGIYNEAENTRNLRNTWKMAIETGSDWVQLATWNDYSENSHINVSANHGWSYLDISAYYAAWFKTGAPPEIKRDVMYLTHRIQDVDTPPAFPQTRLMKLSGGQATYNKVEILTFATGPGTVDVKIGSSNYSCDVNAGVNTCLLPLEPGKISATLSRNNAMISKVSSPYEVTTSPYVQNYNYFAVSSGRTPDAVAQPSSSPVPSTSASPTPTTTSATLSPSTPAITPTLIPTSASPSTTSQPTTSQSPTVPATTKPPASSSSPAVPTTSASPTVSSSPATPTTPAGSPTVSPSRPTTAPTSSSPTAKITPKPTRKPTVAATTTRIIVMPTKIDTKHRRATTPPPKKAKAGSHHSGNHTDDTAHNNTGNDTGSDASTANSQASSLLSDPEIVSAAQASPLAQSSSATAKSSDHQNSNSGTWLWVGSAIAILALAGGGFTFLRLRRK